MTIKNALKEKNRLVGIISIEMERLKSYNSIDVETKRPYDAKEAYRNVWDYTFSLIDLKTKIHLANAPVYNKIFKLSELKNLIKNLRELDCSEGKVSPNRYSSTVETIQKSAQISIVDRDIIISDFVDEINNIQDELDNFNAITNIN